MKTEIEITGTLVITHIKIGDKIIPIGEGKSETIQEKETICVDCGQVVGRVNGTPIHKNVLDEVRKTKTKTEMKLVLIKYYPHCKPSTIDSYVYGYGSALRRGMPSVPLKGRVEQIIEKASGSVEKRHYHKRKPFGALFKDTSAGVWIMEDEYNAVSSYVKEKEDVTKKILVKEFPLVKEWRLDGILRKMVKDRDIFRRYSSGDYTWHYIVYKKNVVEEREDIKRHNPFTNVV